MRSPIASLEAPSRHKVWNVLKTHQVVTDIRIIGYWMPMAAAKAVAAKFAWPIRHLLTPVFGPDFPSLCTQPQNLRDSPNMDIDPAIIAQCKREQERWIQNPIAFGQLSASDVPLRTATRHSPTNRRTPRANSTKTASGPSQQLPGPTVPHTPLAPYSSLPTPTLPHQGSSESSRKRKRKNDGRKLPPITGVPSAIHSYPSPRSPEYPSRGAKYSPDISLRENVRRRTEAAHYPSPDSPELGPSLSSKELDAVEGLLKLSHGGEEARRMVSPVRPPSSQYRPATTSGLGLRHLHDASIQPSPHHLGLNQPHRAFTTSAPPGSQRAAEFHAPYQDRTGRTLTHKLSTISSSDDSQTTVSTPRSPDPHLSGQRVQYINRPDLQVPSQVEVEAARLIIQLHEADVARRRERAQSVRLPSKSKFRATPEPAGRVGPEPSVAVGEQGRKQPRNNEMVYINIGSSNDEDSDEESDEQLLSTEEYEEDDDYEEPKQPKTPPRPAKRARRASRASGKARK
jgi:hypothetical protein